MRLKRYGAWPVDGGTLAQSPVFLDAVDVVDVELGRMEKAKTKPEKT